MRTLHKFESWDKVDADIKQFRRQANMSDKFEINHWAFADFGLYQPIFWHNTRLEELPYIPAGVWITCLTADKTSCEREEFYL